MSQIDRCAIWLADKEGTELSVSVSMGIEAKKLEGAYVSLDEDYSVVARAFKTRQLQLVSQVDADRETLAPELRTWR